MLHISCDLQQTVALQIIRKFSNYLQPSPLRQLLQPATSVNEALVT